MRCSCVARGGHTPIPLWHQTSDLIIEAFGSWVTQPDAGARMIEHFQNAGLPLAQPVFRDPGWWWARFAALQLGERVADACAWEASVVRHTFIESRIEANPHGVTAPQACTRYKSALNSCEAREYPVVCGTKYAVM
jgi:hypothetical protein